MGSPMNSSEPRVSVDVIQGLFDLLVPLNQAMRERCGALGFDPERLSPDYPLGSFSELLVAVAQERFSHLPLDQALDLLGRENVKAMQKRHVWLSAMLPMMRLLGPHRVMSKANARRIGQTNTELIYTSRGAFEGELVIRPCPLPAFLGGVVAQVVINAGGREARTEVLSQSSDEATLRVGWQPN